ncbi:MAG: hypothetical protein IPJ74_08365 [Saprospiraceae bacterium]|nr:hypothetical protein [Saprospiraceae bacterium]
MNANIGKRKTFRIISLFLLLIILAIICIWFWNKNKSISKKDWEGFWTITYYYEQAPNFPYTGVLKLQTQGALKGQLEVFLPKSTRSTFIELSNLALSEDETLLRGAFFYPYKIREGFVQEAFELKMENPNEFKGKGKCIAFCAEETEEVAIIWEGQKSDLTSNKN